MAWWIKNIEVVTIASRLIVLQEEQEWECLQGRYAQWKRISIRVYFGIPYTTKSRACRRPTSIDVNVQCTALTPRVPVPSLSLIVHSPHFVLLIRIGLWAGAAILLRQLDATQPTPTVSLVSIIVSNDEPGACRELNKQLFLPQSF